MSARKTLAVILILALCGLSAASCANGKDVSGLTGDTADTGAAETSTQQEATSYKADYLPDATYDGYEFRMVAPVNGAYDLTLSANADEESGEIVNDAIYNRNRIIEERYGVRIRQIDAPDYAALSSMFRKSVTAGSDDFDLCMLISRDAWALALEGMMLPVDSLPYVDVSQPWYAHDVNSEITIGGKLYFAYSDECLNMFEQTIIIAFNKQIQNDLSLGDLYSLTESGKWTQAKFFEYAKAATADLDGDGTMTDTDRYGIVSMSDFFYPCFWVSSGIKTVGKDSGDLLVFNGSDPKLLSVLDSVHQNLFGGEKILFDVFSDKITSYTYEAGEAQRRVTHRMFENNSGLFLISHIGSIPALRGMETDFGILPFPKYDDSQEKYYSRVIDGWINCVPATAPDPSRTSVIMESLAVESRNYTIPAYFETALRTKYARDDESQQMLDIIYAGRTMDMGDTFYMDPVRNLYMNVLTAKKNNFASVVESKTASVENTLQKANDAAANLR